MAQEGSSGGSGFWSTLPGLFTGLAALITAVGGIYALTREQAEAGGAKSEPSANVQAAVPAPDRIPAAQSEAPTAPRDALVPPGEVAVPNPSGPPACIAGYVWREARPGDHVCVTPATRAETAAENESADSRRSPTGGAYGANTCLSGYVWRGAYDGDAVCVEPASRDRAQEDNEAAAQRVAG